MTAAACGGSAPRKTRAPAGEERRKRARRMARPIRSEGGGEGGGKSGEAGREKGRRGRSRERPAARRHGGRHARRWSSARAAMRDAQLASRRQAAICRFSNGRDVSALAPARPTCRPPPRPPPSPAARSTRQIEPPRSRPSPGSISSSRTLGRSSPRGSSGSPRPPPSPPLLQCPFLSALRLPGPAAPLSGLSPSDFPPPFRPSPRPGPSARARSHPGALHAVPVLDLPVPPPRPLLIPSRARAPLTPPLPGLTPPHTLAPVPSASRSPACPLPLPPIAGPGPRAPPRDPPSASPRELAPRPACAPAPGP